MVSFIVEGMLVKVPLLHALRSHLLPGLGFGVWGLGIGVWGLGLGVWG